MSGAYSIPMAYENAASLCVDDPDELRRKVVTGGADTFATGLIDALKPRIRCDLCQQKSGYNRWAYGLFAKVAKLVQADTLVLVALLGKFGLRDESELKALVDSGRKLERLGADMSHQGLFEDSLEALRLCLNAHPEWKGKALARLGAVETIQSENASILGSESNSGQDHVNGGASELPHQRHQERSR